MSWSGGGGALCGGGGGRGGGGVERSRQKRSPFQSWLSSGIHYHRVFSIFTAAAAVNRGRSCRFINNIFSSHLVSGMVSGIWYHFLCEFWSFRHHRGHSRNPAYSSDFFRQPYQVLTAKWGVTLCPYSWQGKYCPLPSMSSLLGLSTATNFHVGKKNIRYPTNFFYRDILSFLNSDKINTSEHLNYCTFFPDCTTG